MLNQNTISMPDRQHYPNNNMKQTNKHEKKCAWKKLGSERLCCDENRISSRLNNRANIICSYSNIHSRPAEGGEMGGGAEKWYSRKRDIERCCLIEQEDSLKLEIKR